MTAEKKNQAKKVIEISSFHPTSESITPEKLVSSISETISYAVSDFSNTSNQTEYPFFVLINKNLPKNPLYASFGDFFYALYVDLKNKYHDKISAFSVFPQDSSVPEGLLSLLSPDTIYLIPANNSSKTKKPNSYFLDLSSLLCLYTRTENAPEEKRKYAA